MKTRIRGWMGAVLVMGILFSELPARAESRDILRDGFLGAGVGAIAAEASGGDAGTGALVGAGTHVIGGALLDYLSAPSQPQQPVYYAPQGSMPASGPVKKHVIRKFDGNGKIVSEEEFWE